MKTKKGLPDSVWAAGIVGVAISLLFLSTSILAENEIQKPEFFIVNFQEIIIKSNPIIAK